MRLTPPYPTDLLRIARKVVWFDAPGETLGDLETFLTHLMVYGSPADVTIVQRYVSKDEFRKVLEEAPPGIFTAESWQRWHEHFGIAPVPPLPRRRFPDGTFGPEPGTFFSVRL